MESQHTPTTPKTKVEEYERTAREFEAKADATTNPSFRTEYQRLARGYRDLAAGELAIESARVRLGAWAIDD